MVIIKIHVLQTGTVNVDIGVPLKQKNPLAPTGWFRDKKNRVWLPVTAYLIEHPRGLVLIDTGWDMAQRRLEPVKRTLGQLPISYGTLPEGLAINEQIESLGFNTSDIDYVFITHMDLDHAGGLKLVEDARHIYASKEEIRASQKVRYFYRYHKKLWEGMDIQSFQFTQTGIGPVGKSYDVFDDGSLVLVSTPGHSHGMFTALVNGEEKYVAICGDTGYMEKSWKELWLPGLTVDKSKAMKSLKWLKMISQDENCVEILATHDPAVKPHVIEL